MTRSQARYDKEKADLQSRRQALLKELADIDKDTADIDEALSQIPSSIVVHEDKKKSLARQAHRF